MHRHIPIGQFAGAMPDPVAVYRPGNGPLAAMLAGVGVMLGIAHFATAVELREQALAKLHVAHGYVQGDKTVKAEDQPAFDAAMAEFHELDAQVQKAAGQDEAIARVDERMAWYTGKETGEPMRFNRTSLDPSASKSIGRQFVESPAYKQLVASGSLNSPDSRFRSDPVVVGRRPVMGAAASDIVHTESGGPGNALVTPYYLPGVLGLPQAPAVVRSLFANEPMTAGDSISYAAQVGFDNAAAAVAQAQTADDPVVGVKPQSSISWERRTAQAEWIATWMVATRQTLADVNQAASLIDNQGRLMVRIVEDDQLLNGNGTSPNISGIRDQVAMQTLDLTGVDNLDGIRTARRMVKTGLSRLDASFLIVHPVDSEEIDLLKDLQGNYRGGNPIGQGFGIGDLPVWRLRRVESEAIAEGHGLVGSGAAATVFDRQPLTVITADQHADFFVRNLIVVLFEERLAFPVFFPTAFVEITFADWLNGSGSGVPGSGGGI